jgi:uncharacterized protein YoxC
MIDPVFWLGISLLLVAVSLTAVLVVTIPTLQEVARAARSAEKLFDTLNREFPPTLEAIRLTGIEINQLTDELDRGVESATGIVQQVDKAIATTRGQVQQAQINTRSIAIGFKAAWQAWKQPESNR